MTSESPGARAQLALGVTTELYNDVKKMWINHSKAEDARDLDGLIATLAEDCVYEIIPTGTRWEGHDGAREFYTTFLTAFPNVRFDLRDIVIGPQGVIEVTQMSGTHRGVWAGMEPTRKKVSVPIVIHFPWNVEPKKFSGEKIYFDTAEFTKQLAE
ncbi:MAG: ester cyclase [Chloroflexi bacterium]|nr:ester cyclase [Chloroflexota bacterium]